MNKLVIKCNTCLKIIPQYKNEYNTYKNYVYTIQILIYKIKIYLYNKYNEVVIKSFFYR